MEQDCPSPQVVVFDLDETLIHTLHVSEWEYLSTFFQDPKYGALIRSNSFRFTITDALDSDIPGYGGTYSSCGVIRPGARDLLKYCFNRFRSVVVWSAGQDAYVQRVVDHLFLGLPRPHLILSWSDCPKEQDGGYNKALHILRDYQHALGHAPDLSSIFIVDDRTDNFTYHNPGNGIAIPPYKPNYSPAGLTRPDSALQQLMVWFDKPEVKNAKDVRVLDKTNIFSHIQSNYV